MAKKNDTPSAMERLIGMAIGGERAIGLQDDPAIQKYPRIWEWMTTIYVGADYVKQPATLSVTMGPEGVLIKLTDQDLVQVLETSCTHLALVLDQLESVLAGPNPPWRQFSKKQPTLRKRKPII